MNTIVKISKLSSVLLLSLAVSACGSSMNTKGSTDQSSNGSSSNGGEVTPPTTSEPEVPPGSVTPEPEPPIAEEPAPFDIFSDIASVVGLRVDNYYSNYRELMVQRSSTSAHRVDSCDPKLDQKFTFADRVGYYVQKNMEPRSAKLAYIGELFGMSGTQANILPTSLASHAMCNVTAASLATTIGSARVPSAEVIAKANTFANRYNDYRSKMLKGNVQAKVDLTKLLTRTMMCLSYVESLTTADTSTSEKAGAKYAPSGYRKPAGVKFYEDANQPPESRLNIGLYQFTPTAGGNINPCIKQWNEIYPSCQVSTGSSQAEMIKVVGSAYQTFNAFCGTNKLTQLFSVQVNSSRAKNTHPSNLNSSGSLKTAANRCVSLHFLPGNSYNHFGPFQNSTGSNLNTLLTCALAQ